jgi:ABC-type multidrug transport system fused ATPase/permease subunit
VFPILKKDRKWWPGSSSKEKVQLEEPGLAAFAKCHVAEDMRPRYFKIVSDFPMTRSGKVQKFVLSEMAAKEFEKGNFEVYVLLDRLSHKNKIFFASVAVILLVSVGIALVARWVLVSSLINAWNSVGWALPKALPRRAAAASQAEREALKEYF